MRRPGSTASRCCSTSCRRRRSGSSAGSRPRHWGHCCSTASPSRRCRPQGRSRRRCRRRRRGTTDSSRRRRRACGWRGSRCRRRCAQPGPDRPSDRYGRWSAPPPPRRAALRESVRSRPRARRRGLRQSSMLSCVVPLSFTCGYDGPQGCESPFDSQGGARSAGYAATKMRRARPFPRPRPTLESSQSSPTESALTQAVSAIGRRSSSGNSSSISSPSSASSLALARISSCRARSREKPKCSPSSLRVIGLSFMIRCSMM